MHLEILSRGKFHDSSRFIQSISKSNGRTPTLGRYLPSVGTYLLMVNNKVKIISVASVLLNINRPVALKNLQLSQLSRYVVKLQRR